ncbi:hypothetical protein [Nibricoccus aquaticus]|nr:hypothetical protein [Nibricoccus aquaticus]
MPPRPLSFRTSLRLTSLSLAAALALGGAACHSGPPRGPGGGREAIHIPVMEAAGNFFDGQLTANIHFGRAQLPNRPGTDDDPRNDARSLRDGGRGGFSANAGMGPMNMSGGGGGGRGPGGGGPREDPDAQPARGTRARTEQNPAVQLHLTLTNTSAQPLDIEVLEFSSLLGNFAVHPAKTSIAPGTTATFDPMTSRLGIPQGDLPLKIRLRSLAKTEEQTLTLKIISQDDSPPL